MKTRNRAQVEKLESRTLLSAWSTVDSYQLAASQSAMPRGMASDSAGNVYAAGRAYDSAGVSHAIIREKVSGGSAWNTIEDTISAASFGALSIDAKGDIFVNTTSASGGWNSGWQILERVSGHTAFSQIDKLSGGNVNGLTSDAAGDVFATGTAAEGSQRRWLARERKAGTSGFVTVDDFIGSDPSDGSGAFGVGIDPAENIYVAGRAADPSGNPSLAHSIVRSNAGGAWKTVDDYQGNTAYGYLALTVNTGGNLYAAADNVASRRLLELAGALAACGTDQPDGRPRSDPGVIADRPVVD